MVRCWYIRDHAYEERFAENFERENATVSIQDLHSATGALYWKLNADTYETEGTLAQIRADRGYSYSDEITISEKSFGAEFDSKQRMFFQEHFHADEEIRFVLDGEGYFDMRDFKTGKWIRVFVEKGDLLLVPAGEYHRFALTTKQHVRVLRLFVGSPVWTAINRNAESDVHSIRNEYLQKMKLNRESAQSD